MESFATEVQKCCSLFENKMSDANREQTTALLNSVWNSITADIAKRNISVAKLNEIANGLLARTPEMAKTQN
jgi:protease-4